MSEENVAIARAALAAASEGDLDALLALIDPDVEFKSLLLEAEGGLYRGHDGVRQWLAAAIEAFPDFRTEPAMIRDLGDDRILAKLVLRGTAGGVEVSQTMWQTVRFREGRIAAWAIFRTEREALEAAGLRE